MTKVRRRGGIRWLSVVGALLTSALLIMTLGALPAQASADSFTASVKIPVSVTVFVPCANGGAGEFVDLSGNLHDLFHVTIDNASGAHLKILANPQGVQGTGATTGAKYQGAGVTQTYRMDGSGGLPFTVTFVDNFRIIGQGADNNYLIHENMTVTVNASGTITALVDHFSATCQ